MKCEQKKRYSYTDIKLMTKWKSVEREKRMYYYKCHCGWYHLTSKSPQEYKKTRNLGILNISNTFTSKDYLEIEQIFKNYANVLSSPSG